MVKHPVSSETAQDFIDNVYQDRGMMKWRGFMLSEHKDILDNQNNNEPTQLDQQPRDMILNLLNDSYNKQTSITVQLNYFENGIPVEIKGVLSGFNEDVFGIKGYDEHFEIETIRNIRTN